MKKMSISRASHPATFRKCKNLGQLIASVEKQGEAEKLFVVKVFLNGKVMDEEEENLLDSLSVNEVQSLEFEMSSMQDIISKSITDIIASIQTIQLNAIKFAKEFRQNESVDDEKVKFVLIQCRSTIEALEQIFVAHNRKSFHIKHLSLWHESEKELTNILQCILQSRKMSDVNFLSDLVEYDLVQALDQWEEVLEKELIDNPSFTGIFKLKSRVQKSDNGVDA